MIKTTVYVDEEIALALSQLARAQGRSQADLIRRAVALYIDQSSWPQPKGIGAYNSGHADISERARDILKSATLERQWP